MNIYGASVSIPKTTPEGQLAAWLFVKHLVKPEIQAEWVKVSNYYPVRQTAAEYLQDYFAENQAYKRGFDFLPYGKYEPQAPGYDFVRDLAEEALVEIVKGSDVLSTLDRLNEAANAILADQMMMP